MRMQYWGKIFLYRNKNHRDYDMPQKINHNHNYIETQNENDYNNRSAYNIRI